MSGFDITKVIGVGTDSMDKGVLGMPFIKIIQKGSPEFDETHADYAEKQIPNCRPGNVVFAPARKILPLPLKVIPLQISSFYTEWKPEGGFVSNRPLSVVADRNYKKGAAGTPDQYKEWLGTNELQFTIMASVMFLLGDVWTKGLISFTSTQLKPGRIWQKQILNLRYPDMPEAQPPIFAAIWEFSTNPETNAKGGWYGWNIKLDRMLDRNQDEMLLTESYNQFQSEQARLPASAPTLAVEDSKKDVPF